MQSSNVHWSFPFVVAAVFTSDDWVRHANILLIASMPTLYYNLARTGGPRKWLAYQHENQHGVSGIYHRDSETPIPRDQRGVVLELGQTPTKQRPQTTTASCRKDEMQHTADAEPKKAPLRVRDLYEELGEVRLGAGPLPGSSTTGCMVLCPAFGGFYLMCVCIFKTPPIVVQRTMRSHGSGTCLWCQAATPKDLAAVFAAVLLHSTVRR